MTADAVDVAPLSRTALKAQRLKPAPDQEPVKRVWSRKRRGYIELFDKHGPAAWKKAQGILGA